jgi:RNA polymerase sigma-70 factor (ECF subfamily)
MAPHSDDKELLKRIAESDRSAFAILYKQHLNNLYRYIFLFTNSKERTEEIIQDVFVKIWERREKLENVSCFRAYLYRCAKNLLIDQIRKDQLETKVLTFLKGSEESCSESDARINFNQYYQITQEAINLLPEKRQKIVRLRTNEDLSLDEIAEKMSISKFVVKKQLYSGMNFIRKYLRKYGEISYIVFPFCLFLR